MSSNYSIITNIPKAPYNFPYTFNKDEHIAARVNQQRQLWSNKYSDDYLKTKIKQFTKELKNDMYKYDTIFDSLVRQLLNNIEKRQTAASLEVCVRMEDDYHTRNQRLYIEYAISNFCRLLMDNGYIHRVEYREIKKPFWQKNAVVHVHLQF